MCLGSGFPWFEPLVRWRHCFGGQGEADHPGGWSVCGRRLFPRDHQEAEGGVCLTCFLPAHPTSSFPPLPQMVSTYEIYQRSELLGKSEL